VWRDRLSTVGAVLAGMFFIALAIAVAVFVFTINKTPDELIRDCVEHTGDLQGCVDNAPDP